MTLDISCEQLTSQNRRVQAQLIKFSNVTLLYINTYFPTDPQTPALNDNELSDVLIELERIMDTAQFDHVLLNGDINYDPSRQSAFARAVREWLQRVNLYSVWDKFPVDYTHIHMDFASTSTLDHFVCNEALLQHVTQAAAMHLGDNPSRHSPIMLRLDLGVIPPPPRLVQGRAEGAVQLHAESVRKGGAVGVAGLTTVHSGRIDPKPGLNRLNT